MNKIKRGTLKTRSMEIKMKRLMYMYGVVFLNLLYKSILEKVTQGNRPLFPEVVVNLFLWYDKWTITSESVDELIVLRIHGKQGELIAYDAMLEELVATQNKTMSVAEFMSDRLSRFKAGPVEPDIFKAGLEVEIVHGTEREVVTHVKECEWARYYRERHPRVGYMMACSIDNADFGTFNKNIRLQRTSTLMEGGKICDFRVYELNPNQINTQP